MLTDALLLRASDYRDADRIVTLFTRDAGKLSGDRARCTRLQAALFGALEPYAVIRVELSEARRGELYTLKRAELVQAFPASWRTLARMDVAGAALCAVARRPRAELPDAALFMATVQLSDGGRPRGRSATRLAARVRVSRDDDDGRRAAAGRYVDARAQPSRPSGRPTSIPISGRWSPSGSGVDHSCFLRDPRASGRIPRRRLARAWTRAVGASRPPHRPGGAGRVHARTPAWGRSGAAVSRAE